MTKDDEYGFCTASQCVNIPILSERIHELSDERKKQTNADRIRSMSDEELAEQLATYDSCPSSKFERNCTNVCEACWLAWLKAEVEDAEKPF